MHTTVEGCIEELSDIHRFVYRSIDDDLLWSSSMPCMLGQTTGADRNLWAVERRTHEEHLSARSGAGYGRLMQTISGIHYNFSIPEPVALIPSASAFRDDAYFGLIRNFRRHSWLLIYLFGASPS